LDKDTSSIEFKTFHSDPRSLYPSVSLCFRDNIFGDQFIDDYQEFLSGCVYNEDSPWNSSFADKVYDHATIDLVDYVIGEITEFDDQSKYVYRKFEEREIELTGKPTTIYGYAGGNRVYTSLRMWNEKCVTFDMPFKNGKTINHHSILLNNSVFLDQTRPKSMGFVSLFHYPNQITKKTSKMDSWDSVDKLLNQPCDEELGYSTSYCKSSYTMKFNIDNVSVLKRRNKRDLACIQNWMNYDNEIKFQIFKTLECKPNHWNLSVDLPYCTTQQQMIKSLEVEVNPTIPPCYAIEGYSVQRNEYPGLEEFDMGDYLLQDIFGIKWDTENSTADILSEIFITFGGRCILF
jgi:hypothetical protein